MLVLFVSHRTGAGRIVMADIFVLAGACSEAPAPFLPLLSPLTRYCSRLGTMDAQNAQQSGNVKSSAGLSIRRRYCPL